MKITIKDKEYNLKYSIRALFLYERIAQKPFEANTIEDQFIFFYCLLLSSNPDMDMSFDDFIEAVDSGDLDTNEINQFVKEQQQKQLELQSKKSKKSDTKKPVKKK